MTRDEIAQAMQDTAGNSWGNEAHFQRFAALLLAAEREACAKMVEDWDSDSADPRDIADATRARGQA